MALDIAQLKKNKPTSKTGKNEDVFAFLNKDIELFGSGLSDKKKEAFYLEMSILLSAGVDIKTALEIIWEEQTNQKDKTLFSTLKNNIVGGTTLSDAIKLSEKFSDYEFFSLQIGEESGKLSLVLQQLAAYYQSKIKQRRQLVSALSYPLLVLSTSFGAIFFMMNFIVPMFADIFKRFGGNLPAITQAIVSISAIINNYILYVLVLIIGLLFFLLSQKEKIWFKKYSAKAMIKIPLMGALIKKIYLARFCYSMNLLISSKIPILRALDMIKKMIGFYPIEVAITQIEAEILQGNSLHQSMAAHEVFPKRMVSLVKVGEEVNQLEVFFEKIAKQYTEEIEHQTGLIGSLIEPVMIIFLGLVVGIILIAMYLPLFQLSNSFQ
jgi:type IV pilus assembly protein PilC